MINTILVTKATASAKVTVEELEKEDPQDEKEVLEKNEIEEPIKDTPHEDT